MNKTREKRICAVCTKEFEKPIDIANRDWKIRKCCNKTCRDALKKNTPPWNKGIPSPFFGELNNKWKGDNVSYSGIHHWVAKWKGKPCKCEKCGRTDLEKHNYHWANIDHKYKRVLDDYIRLCVQCHCDYDKENKLK